MKASTIILGAALATVSGRTVETTPEQMELEESK